MAKLFQFLGSLTVVLALLAASAAAAPQQKEEPTVGGTWSMAVKGQGAHGDTTAGLTLTQKGSKVSGRLSAHGSEHALEGEFTRGSLKLSTSGGDTNQRITLSAVLKDGALKGYMSGPMGDLQWTAERVKSK